MIMLTHNFYLWLYNILQLKPLSWINLFIPSQNKYT